MALGQSNMTQIGKLLSKQMEGFGSGRCGVQILYYTILSVCHGTDSTDEFFFGQRETILTWIQYGVVDCHLPLGLVPHLFNSNTLSYVFEGLETV
jgi:hypothetical protein